MNAPHCERVPTFEELGSRVVRTIDHPPRAIQGRFVRAAGGVIGHDDQIDAMQAGALAGAVGRVLLWGP